MNHLAFNVPPEKTDASHERLVAAGLYPGVILTHDDSERQISLNVISSTFVLSIYFFDPDGVCPEFAAGLAKPIPRDV